MKLKGEWVHIRCDGDGYFDESKYGALFVVTELPKILKGEVLGIGNGVRTKYGLYAGSELEVENIVYFKRESRYLMEDNKEFLVKESDILFREYNVKEKQIHTKDST